MYPNILVSEVDFLDSTRFHLTEPDQDNRRSDGSARAKEIYFRLTATGKGHARNCASLLYVVEAEVNTKNAD